MSGGRVGRVSLTRSRFADVARLAGLTLTLGEDARAFHQLGWARNATGDRAAALAAYDQALRLHRAAGDRGNEAATLSNIGIVYGSGGAAAGAGVLWAGVADLSGGWGPGRGGDHAEQHRRGLRGLGEPGSGRWSTTGRRWRSPGGRGPGRRGGHAEQHRHRLPGHGGAARALQYYGQALPIHREVGDRGGEAATLSNIGAVYRGHGEPRRRCSTSGRRCRSPGGRGPGRGGDHAEQHRPRVGRSGRIAAGAGVLRAGAADPPGGRGPGRGGDHADQHRHRLRRPGQSAAGAGVLRAGAADPAGGRGPGRGGGHAEQHRRGVPRSG